MAEASPSLRQEDGRGVPGGPDAGLAGVGVEREDLAGDKLAGRELGGDHGVDVGEHGGGVLVSVASVTKATDGHVGEQRGREVVTHGVEDPDDGLAGPDGIVERVAGHAVRTVGGCRRSTARGS